MAHVGDPPPLLEMDGIVVAFGGVRVLDRAGLRVGRGEVHALLGENGAGKSSLMKVLYGLYQMTDGRILLRGEPVEIRNPHQALERGVAMIHQELPFALHLSTADNIFLGREHRNGVFIDNAQQNAAAAELLKPFPVQIDPTRPMSELSVAQQQIVAIAKAISTGADLIVLDEATTALTGQETQQLFELLRRLKRDGKTFVMITHKLDEIFEVADRVTVMRDGATVGTFRVGDVEPKDLVQHMVGREVEDIFPRRRGEYGEEVLRVEGLGTRKLKDISFRVRRGEVLGVAGLMGAGRTSLFNALFGAIPVSGGEIRVGGRAVAMRAPHDAIAHKMAYVTEDRKANGLALQLEITDNVSLCSVGEHTRWGWINDGALGRISRHYVDKLKIHAKASKTVGALSGGNQQKVVLAKWLATGADVFLMDEPTRGIDVGTKMEVYDLINELTRAGKAVLLVSSELPELMAMSDRFLVLSEGRLVRELSKDEATPEQIVYYASMKPDGNN